MKDGRGRQNQPAGGLCSAAAGDQVSRSPQVRRIRAQRMERRFTMVSDSQEKEVRAASRHHGSWGMKLQLRKRRVDVFFSVSRGGPRLHEGMMRPLS